MLPPCVLDLRQVRSTPDPDLEVRERTANGKPDGFEYRCPTCNRLVIEDAPGITAEELREDPACVFCRIDLYEAAQKLPPRPPVPLPIPTPAPERVQLGLFGD